MTLRTYLADVRNLGYDPAAGSQQEAQKHLRRVRAGIADHLPPTGFLVRVSGAAVNLPRIAWVAVLDPDVTRTAQSGLYVVYLFDALLDRVYLTMNQGATAHRIHVQSAPRRKNQTIDQAAIAELEAESIAIRDKLPSSLLGGDARSINLRAEGFLPKGYEAGTICAIEYDLTALPQERQLQNDLERYLLIYDAAVEARRGLTAADPVRFSTPAVGVPPKPSSSAELFRPKSDSDYVAQIAAHTQTRERRHEAVVKAFGEFVVSQGWTPITTVHPRDLVLRRATSEVLCEVKVVKANAQDAVREAIGQLFTYRHFLYSSSPPSALVAVFSEPIGDAFVHLLEELGIASVWALPGGIWAGSPTAESFELL